MRRRTAKKRTVFRALLLSFGQVDRMSGLLYDRQTRYHYLTPGYFEIKTIYIFLFLRKAYNYLQSRPRYKHLR